MRIQILIPLAVASLLTPLSGQVFSGVKFPAARQQRRDKYVGLRQKIYALPESTEAERRAVNGVPTEQVEQVTNELHDLVVADIKDSLAGPNASAQGIAKGIESLLGETSISNWDTQFSNTPLAHFTDIAGTRLLSVAYGILRGGGALPNSRSWVEFYSPASRTWDLKAAAPLDFDQRTFFVSPLPSPLAGQVWILAWGRRCGDTGGALRIRLYAFDGTAVRTIWQRDDLIWGSVTVAGQSVTLEYEKEYHAVERTREILYVTPNGLQ